MACLAAKSNKDLEAADEVIIMPPKEDVQYYKDPIEYINRLDKIESPNQRLITLTKSIFNFKEESTHEAYLIRYMFLSGALGGMLFGAFMSKNDVTSSFIRSYNASVFEGKYRAKRMYYDRLISGLFSHGLNHCFKTSLLTGSAGIISFGSITYRNKLYFPDWLIGFTTLGGLSRLWLGSRAVAVGGLLGAIVGTFGFGIAKGLEAFSGYSVSQMRYLEHHEWLTKNHIKHMKYLALQEKELKQFNDSND